MRSVMRIGAVNYLNSKPLVYGLDALAPDVRLTYDLPSRLADSLAAGRLDVALIPSVEYFRTAGHAIVSDACVACRGPVLSVKLYFRVPPAKVRRVALDEGSRTSAVLTQILLAELHDVRPGVEPLPIGCGLEASDADAVLLIGDRAIARGEGNPQSVTRNPQSELPDSNDFVEIWDLGEKWCDWTGLPFVFAMWVARPGVDVAELAAVLNRARDEGMQHVVEIANREAPLIGVTQELAIGYLRDNLHFGLADKEREGLQRFYELCVGHGLAPSGLRRVLSSRGKSRTSRQEIRPGGRR
jgi:chorismate dehydratase